MKPFIPQKLPPSNLEWKEFIPLISKANRSLAYYNGILQGVANPDLFLSPMTTQEAVLSSRIEGTQATLSDVFQFEAGETQKDESKREDIREIINYRSALHKAEKELRAKPFNLNLLKELHVLLLNSVRGRDKARGKFRTTQNWIGLPGTPIEQAQFVPPDPMYLMVHLHHWEKYYHSDELDALVQLAILHAQFEIIHPFLDGNGRLGRMLIPIFLYEKNVLARPMFYLSAYLETHRDTYYERLRKLGQSAEKAWDKWIKFFLAAVDEQARENADRARAIISLYDRLKQQVLDLTHSQFAVPLLDILFEQPIFSSSNIKRKQGMPSTPMIMNLLGTLKTAGILKVIREGSGRRGRILVLTELINLCKGRKVIE